MAIDAGALEQLLVDQTVADFKAEREKSPTAGDYGRALMAGAADIPAGVGEGLSLLGLESVGAPLRGMGQDAQDYWVGGMTPGGRRAATAPLLESDTPIATTGLKVLQTLPGMVGMGGVGGLAVKGLGIAGKAAGIAALTPEVIAPGITAPAKLATALGFGSAEGAYSGLSNAAQTRSEIMNQDIETLGQNPIYQRHLAATDPSLGDDARQQLAREASSREAEMDVLTKTFLTTGVISAIGGGGVFGALARPTAGVGREALKGALAEAGTEAPQSYLEQVHQNVALNRPATEGALTAGIEGGILGGILGGGFGGFHAAIAPPGTTQAEIDARNAPPVVAPTATVATATVAPDRPFTELSLEETQAAIAGAKAAIAAGRPVVDPANESLRRLFTERRIPFTRPELTTSPGVAEPPPAPRADQIGVEYEGRPPPTIETFEQMGARTGIQGNRVTFERPERPVLTTTPGAATTPPAPRTDQIGVHRFAFAGVEPGIETPAETASRLSAIVEQGPPVASNPTLPKSFRGKTAAEFEAELSVSTLSPKTLERAESYLNNTLRPAAERHAAAVTATAAPGVVAQPLAATPVVAQPAASSEPQAAATASQPSAPEYVAERHRMQYAALRAEAAGLDAPAAEASLQANYSETDGFDADEVRNDIAAARLGQAPFDAQLEALAAKPSRGRPSKEQQVQRTAAADPAAGTISDPDPEIQANARAIVADPAKLAQLRELADSTDFRPTTQRLKKAVDELISTSRAVTAQPDAFARPEALGPATVAEEDLPTWSQLLAEFRAVGMTAPEAKALIESHYDPFTGFDTTTLAAELQSRDTAAIREELAKAQNPRLANIRRAAERAQSKSPPTARDAELARLVAEQESDDAGLDFASLAFSRGLSPRASAQKLADVRAVVARVVKQWRRPPFGGVQVHETVASLPRGLQREVYSQGAHGDVRGIYDADTKTVHLIASHLTTPEEVEFVLFHEVLGHFGLRGFLGPNIGATMRDLYRQNPKLREAANALRKEFGYDVETATEEALADMAGLNLPVKGLALLLGKVQKALRKLGLGSVADWLEKRTNAEVLTVLAQARAFVTEAQGPFIYTPIIARRLYSYGGPRAVQANQTARSAAEQFDDLGIPMEQIRQTTGWFKGLDGKWKFEIPDTGVTLKPDVDNAKTVGDLIDHPTLFVNYPQLRDVEVRWKDWPKEERAGVSSEGRLLINSHLPDSQLLSVVLHEMQHLVQAIEGFARGGSPTSPEVVEAAAQAGGTPEALFEMYQNLAGEIEARDVQARARMSDEERAANAPYTSEPRSGKPILRFKRATASGTPGVDDLAADIGEFYNFSAPFQRAFQKLAGWGSKSGAARSLRLALDRRVTSPYHIAASGGSKGFTNLFQNVLRPMQQFSDYLISTMMEPIQRTWIKGQGLGQPPPEFEAAARALFAHNDAAVSTAEFFGDPKYANLTPKARELYDQIRETIKRGLMAEFTAKAVRMREVLADPEIYNQTLTELYAVTQQRIDRGFIPNKRHGEFAIGVYHTTAKHTDSAGRLSLAGQPMQWYTFESIGEAKAAAEELRTLFKDQTDIVLDIDAVGQGEPLTVERAANDRYSSSSYWDFLQQAKAAGIEISEEQKGKLAKLMIQSESALQNKIQKRKGVAGYSKDLMRTIGEFVTSTGFSAAQTQMSARVVHAMNRHADLTPEQFTELAALQAQFKDLEGVSESRVYEQLSGEADLAKRFEALAAYSRMKFLEVSGKQFWSQDGADTGYYRDRASELIEFLKEPKSSWADKYRTLAALHFLGGSAASAIVNLSSLPMFAAPYLHQFAGARAYSSLTKHFMAFAKQPALRDTARLSAALDPQARSSGQAAKDWADLQPLGEDLLQAVRRAAEEGIVSDSQLYEVFGLARGGLLGRSSAARKAVDAWMKPFQYTEQANRFSTFMAAFEIGRDVKKLSGAELYDFARDAVDQTQAIYGPINRQPWARNPIGHALFTFRAFPLMMTELIRRLPGTQRTLVLGSLLLAAGINGLPFADDLRDIIDTIAQRVFHEPLNTRRLMTNVVAQASEAMLGADISKLVMNGALDALTGASISGRIGLGNLIPGTRVGAAGEDFFQRTMADVLGPVGGEVANFSKVLQGQWSAALPVAANNLFNKAREAAQYGKITDAKGQTLINDVSPYETFLQGLGFTSGRLSQAYEEQRGVLQERAYVEEVREGFYTRIREAVAHSDKDEVTEVGEEVRAWNEGHPQWPIAIRPQQLRSTLSLAGLPLNERTWKMMPRAWRQSQP